MISKKINLLIIGASGAGKGTQADFIAKTFGQKHVIAGDLLAQESKKESDRAKQIRERMNRGLWVDDEIINAIIGDEIKKGNKDQGFILDGFPRTVEQAHFLEKIIKENDLSDVVAINLNVSHDSLVDRLIKRRVCQKCGELYRPPKSLSVKECEKCGGKLIKRKDDNETTILSRLEEYDREVKPVIDFYRSSKRIIDIDGEPDVPQVSAEIKKKLEEYEPKSLN